jgi:hypothetical protein
MNSGDISNARWSRETRVEPQGVVRGPATRDS